MSYFDDASLVMIPSGYKTSKVYSVKPTDGSGDLTFSRSNDTATRVNSAGLIEKVRTNLALYSEEFNQPQYTKVNSTITANAGVAPDGTTTADKLIMNNGQSPTSADNSGWRQNTAITSGIYAFSFYAKAAEFSSVNIRENFNTGAFLNINLTNGVVTNPAPSEFIDATATNVGNGWYRIAWGAPSGTNNIQKYNIRAGVTGDGTSGFLNWGFQVEAGDIATDYIQTTTAAVSVGPVANVPRLDYLNSSCPRLNLEGQRTNLFQYSEQLDNAYWSKIGAITVTANNAVSPDGYQNADLVTGAGGGARIQRAFSGLTAGTRTLSCFVKAGTGTEVTINTYDGIVDKSAIFNVVTGVVDSTSAGVTATITNYGNGWYRLTHTYTSAGTSYSCQFFFNDGLTYRVWGMQFEDSAAYATSYIPTLGAAVTRGVDFGSSSDTIGTSYSSSDFSYFIEFDLLQDSGTSNSPMLFGGGNSALGASYQGYFRLGLSGNNSMILFGHGDSQMASVIYPFTKGTRYKLLVKRSGTSIKFYVNGAQVGATGTSSLDFTLRSIGWSYAAGSYNTYGNIYQFLAFQTALSDADAIALTA